MGANSAMCAGARRKFCSRPTRGGRQVEFELGVPLTPTVVATNNARTQRLAVLRVGQGHSIGVGLAIRCPTCFPDESSCYQRIAGNGEGPFPAPQCNPLQSA